MKRRWRESEDQKAEREVRERRGLIDLLSAEVEAQRVGYLSRAGAMNTRLSILIAAASLVSGLQISTPAPSGWFVVATCLAAFAALTGVFGLWPRGGGENGVKALQDELWNMTPDMGAYVLLHRKLEVLQDDERMLKRRAIYTWIGFAALGGSILFVAIHLLIG